MSSPHNVLIVEDDDRTRTLLAAVVSQYGFSPELAGDAEAAIEQLEDHEFDIILVDLLLPRMDGMELLRRLKKMSPDMLERTIVVTSASELTPRDSAELRSVWRLMTKPVDVDRLTTEMLSCAAEHSSPMRYSN